MKKLDYAFFNRDALEVAPDLVGKLLVRRLPDGSERVLRIIETEAYCGAADTACHAHKGRTPRTELLYMDSGTIYVYLCYGIHWLINVITGGPENPQGVLIRGCAGYNGPGKLTKCLEIDKRFNRQSFVDCPDLCIMDDGLKPKIRTDRRVGISYASLEDQARPWRFILDK